MPTPSEPVDAPPTVAGSSLALAAPLAPVDHPASPSTAALSPGSDSGFSPEQIIFIQWLATPLSSRSPKKQQDLARELGVDKTTLCRWKKLPGFAQAVNDLIHELFNDPRIRLRITKSFLNEASRGSFYHQRLYLEKIGWYNPKAEVEVTTKIIVGVDVDKL